MLGPTANGAPPSYLSGTALTEYSITPIGFTVEFWVRIRWSPGYDGRIIMCGENSGPFGCGTPNDLWQFATCNCSACPKRGVGFSFIANGGCVELNVADTIRDGSWHHVAGTYDGSYVRLYVDGAIADSIFAGSRTVSVGGGPIHFGQTIDALNGIDGQLDEVRIWNVARSQSEIVANMNSEIPVQAGLAAYWKLNGNGSDLVAGNTMSPIGDVSYYSGRLNAAVDFCDQRQCPCCSSVGPGCEPPVDCYSKTTTDPYLVACPKGDSPYEVVLHDGTDSPIAGYGDVWLDFSGCVGANLTHNAAQHPSWPIVYPEAPSDAKGTVIFNVFAGGDCADCQATLNTGCGFSASVPVHSLDVNGDLCVDATDHDLALGLCRDYNDDEIVDGLDAALHAAHLEDCQPTGACSYIAIQANVTPESQVAQGDTVTVHWMVSNPGNPAPCNLDSVILYRYDCVNTGTIERVAGMPVGTVIPTSGALADSMKYVNPDSVDLCLLIRAFSNCCTSPVEKPLRVTVVRLCSPGLNCFTFYMAQQDIVFGAPSPVSLLGAGWDFDYGDTTFDATDWTWTKICVGPNAVAGTEAAYLLYGPSGDLIRGYRVSLEPNAGDVCGITQSCEGDPGQGGPDCILSVVDVVCVVNYVFRNALDPSPCPPENMDFNCDCINNVVDVVIEVDAVFRNKTPPPRCAPGTCP